jgi:hypothetical protein
MIETSKNNIRVIKQGEIWWVEHFQRIGRYENYKIIVWKPEEKGQIESLFVDGRKILQ